MNHRRYYVAAVVVIASLLMSSMFSAYGQGRRGGTRIRFKRGESSAIVNGQLSNKRLNQYFLVGAGAGQELYVQVKGRNDSANSPFLIYIDDPSGKSVAAGPNDDAIRVSLRQTGDYRIKVGLPHFLEGSIQQFSIFVRID